MEGIEGSGKSTLLHGLLAHLRARGIDVEATREPGGTALGDRLRAAFVDPAVKLDPVAEALLLNASRAQLVSEAIAPALGAGRWVLSDRFTTATLAYQGYGRGVDLALLRELAAAATRGVEPELVLLVDIPVELSRRRVSARSSATGVDADRLEREDVAFHERVRAGYLALAEADPRIAVLDGTRPPDVLREAAWEALRARFALV
ncbi:MAG: dTMP kinase [Candidatus Baltobacteraceae bacterium]